MAIYSETRACSAGCSCARAEFGLGFWSCVVGVLVGLFRNHVRGPESLVALRGRACALDPASLRDASRDGARRAQERGCAPWSCGCVSPSCGPRRRRGSRRTGDGAAPCGTVFFKNHPRVEWAGQNKTCLSRVFRPSLVVRRSFVCRPWRYISFKRLSLSLSLSRSLCGLERYVARVSLECALATFVPQSLGQGSRRISQWCLECRRMSWRGTIWPQPISHSSGWTPRRCSATSSSRAPANACFEEKKGFGGEKKKKRARDVARCSARLFRRKKETPRSRDEFGKKGRRGVTMVENGARGTPGAVLALRL